ncbi:MAG: FAD-binding oxidoreductase [Planctomycetota bacterium]
MESADVVVIGAGVIGTSVAYHLSQRNAGLKVLVLEKEKAPCTGSTPLSAGGIRQQFTTEVNVRLSRYAVDFYERMAQELECVFDFEQEGYLFLTAEGETAERVKENVALQTSLDVPVEVLEPAEIRKRWPFLETGDLVLGTFCQTDGYADPYEATMGFYQAVKRDPNVSYRFASPVTGIEVSQGRVQSVTLGSGSQIACQWVIDCAGPWLREVGLLAGIEIPAQPVRRCLWNTEPFAEIQGKIPLTIDMETGFYTRSESGGLMLGLANVNEPPGFNDILDDDWLPEVIEAAVKRIPCLEQAEINRGWAGHYSVTPDHLPVLGPVPGVEGFLSAGGFSGHGFMHAPSTGLLMAEWVVDGKAHTIDVSSLSIERFKDGTELVHEGNVI